MAAGRCRARARRLRQRLRVEFGNRQLLVAEIFLRHGPDLFRCHRLQFFNHSRVRLIGKPDRFELADFVRVENANLADGLLTIELVREVPDAMKPRKIAINGKGEVIGITAGDKNAA